MSQLPPGLRHGQEARAGGQLRPPALLHVHLLLGHVLPVPGGRRRDLAGGLPEPRHVREVGGQLRRGDEAELGAVKLRPGLGSAPPRSVKLEAAAAAEPQPGTRGAETQLDPPTHAAHQETHHRQH